MKGGRNRSTSCGRRCLACGAVVPQGGSFCDQPCEDYALRNGYRLPLGPLRVLRSTR